MKKVTMEFVAEDERAGNIVALAIEAATSDFKVEVTRVPDSKPTYSLSQALAMAAAQKAKDPTICPVMYRKEDGRLSINVPASLDKLNLTLGQLMDTSWPKGTTEARVKQAVVMNRAHANKRNGSAAGDNATPT